jgi:hypothetical protein
MQNNVGCRAGESINCILFVACFSQNTQPTAPACFAVADAVLVADDINGAVEELVAESYPHLHLLPPSPPFYPSFQLLKIKWGCESIASCLCVCVCV